MGRRYPSSGGDVVGPAASVDNEVVLFSGATGKLLKQPGTGAGILPTGTTAQQPGAPATGMFRFNTTLGVPEAYTGAAWRPSGDLVGPASSVDAEFPLYSGVTGKLLQAPGTGAGLLPRGTTAQRPGAPAAAMFRYNTTDNVVEYYNGSGWVQLTAAAAGAGNMVVLGSLAGAANSTIGLMQMFNVSTANPGGVKEQTSTGNPGINNNGPNPILIPKAGTINTAQLTTAHAAVAQATTGGAMTARINLYTVGYSARTLLGSLDFSITSAGVSNNLSGNNFQTSGLTPSLAVAAGDLLGMEFQNRSANNNEINGLSAFFVALNIAFT